MKIRLGYVALSTTLDNITSSSTISYTNYQKLSDNEKDTKLDQIIISNLLDLIKILNYNIKNNIHFYRLTSKLIPLATHDKINYDYINPFINNLLSHHFDNQNGPPSPHEKALHGDFFFKAAD